MEIKIFNPKNGETLTIHGHVVSSNNLHTKIQLTASYCSLVAGMCKWVNTSWIVKGVN